MSYRIRKYDMKLRKLKYQVINGLVLNISCLLLFCTKSKHTMKGFCQIVISLIISYSIGSQNCMGQTTDQRKLWNDGSKIYVSVTDPNEDRLITNALVVLCQNDIIIKESTYIDSLKAYVIDTVVYGRFEIKCDHQDYLGQKRKSYIPTEYRYSYSIKKYKLNQYHFKLGTENHDFFYSGSLFMPYEKNNHILGLKSTWFDTKGFDRFSIRHLSEIKSNREKNYLSNTLYDSLCKIELKNSFPKLKYLEQLLDSLGLKWSENGFNKYIEKKDGSSFNQDSSVALNILRNDSVVKECGPLYKYDINNRLYIFSTDFYIYFSPNIDESIFQDLLLKYNLVSYKVVEVQAHSVKVLFKTDSWVGYGINDISNTMVKNEPKILKAYVPYGGSGY